MTRELRGAAAVRHIDQAKELQVSPVYLAGEDRSGAARVLFPLRDDLGWSVASTGIANTVLDSPCRRARIGYLPTHPLYSSLWVIRVARAPLHPFQWMATFSQGTPNEVVASFAEALAYDLVGGSWDALRPQRDFDRVLSPLRRAGWQIDRHEAEKGEGTIDGQIDEVAYGSPDGLARVQWLRHPVDEAESGGLTFCAGWIFSAGVPGVTWRATFAPEVPDHLVAAASRRLAAGEPVFRGERELPPELREHVTITPVSVEPGPAKQRGNARRGRKPGHQG